MRKALIVGIDHYTTISGLSGCVNDARAVQSVLERNADGTVNFITPRVLLGTGPGSEVSKKELKESVRELFSGDADIALFYFAGHGYIEDTGGFVCASDCVDGDDGLSLTEIMALAGQSRTKYKIIILDSCHSGAVGERTGSRDVTEIKDGMTILTASTSEQPAMEVEGGGAGVFTTLFVDALHGAAANLLGDVTPGSVYAHIDQSLGSWAQRPVFRTNVTGFVSLRKAAAPISLTDLQAIAQLFPRADFQFSLDPAYEPERSEEQRNDLAIPPPDPQKNAVFATLQRYVKVNLVRPVDAQHMWHAAMNSKSCELTVLGEHYRRLVQQNLI